MNQHLVWTCQACEKPIANGAGYIHVDLAATNRRERALAQFKKRHTGQFGLVIATGAWSEMFALPNRATWEAHHRACDPRLDEADYWFDVERARTHAALLSWTAHLMEKAWLDATDWADFIDRSARSYSPSRVTKRG